MAFDTTKRTSPLSRTMATSASEREKSLELDIVENEELKHYGVLGMRWGVRRAVGSNGRIVTASKTEGSKYKKAAGLARGLGAYAGAGPGMALGKTAGVAAALFAASSIPVTLPALTAASLTGGVVGMVLGGAAGHKGVSVIQNKMHKKKIETVLNSKLSDLDRSSRKAIQKSARKYTTTDVSEKGTKLGTVNTRPKR